MVCLYYEEILIIHTNVTTNIKGENIAKEEINELRWGFKGLDFKL